MFVIAEMENSQLPESPYMMGQTGQCTTVGLSVGLPMTYDNLAATISQAPGQDKLHKPNKGRSISTTHWNFVQNCEKLLTKVTIGHSSRHSFLFKLILVT